MNNTSSFNYPLGFNYAYDTSSEPEYPLINTISSDPKLGNEGWSSVRYCSYPQTLILKFIQVVSLSQIKIQFHQYKIPTQVDVFFFNPTSFNDFSLDVRLIPFERLGLIIPNSNEINQYRLREWMSIKVNVTCLYLKLQLKECYSNGLNAFNQVGVIKIECWGKGIGKESTSQLPLIESDKNKIRPSNEIIDWLIRDDDYDETSKAKIGILKDRMYIETIPEMKYEMSIALDGLRSKAKNLIKLKQLERNYLHIGDKAKANEIGQEVKEMIGIIEGYPIPEGSSRYIREYSDNGSNKTNTPYKKIIISDKEYAGNNEEDKYRVHEEDNNSNEVNDNDKVESHHSTIISHYSQQVLQQFLNKKKLIQESHLNAKNAIIRENIFNDSKFNM